MFPKCQGDEEKRETGRKESLSSVLLGGWALVYFRQWLFHTVAEWYHCKVTTLFKPLHLSIPSCNHHAFLHPNLQSWTSGFLIQHAGQILPLADA